MRSPRHISRYLPAAVFIVVLVFLLLFPAYGADPPTPIEACRQAMKELAVHITRDWSAPSAEKSRFEQAERTRRTLQRRMTPEQYREFEDWYYDHFFWDQRHTLIDNLRSKRDRLHSSNRYNSAGERPMAGYLVAREYLFGRDVRDLTLVDVQTAHRRLLDRRVLPDGDRWYSWLFYRNSEATPEERLGVIRSSGVGYVDSSDSLSPLALRRLTDGSPLSESPQSYAQLFEHNRLVLKTSPSWVSYAPFSRWRHMRERLSPELVEKILEMERNLQVIPPEHLDSMVKEREAEIRRRFAAETSRGDEVLEKRYGWWPWLLKRRRKAFHEFLASRLTSELESERRALRSRSLGLDQAETTVGALRQEYYTELANHLLTEVKEKLKQARTEAEVVEAVANFHYDFLSLHPFANGNGRITRILSERLLESRNLPPPIWLYHGEDVVLRRDDFVQLMKDAVALSKKFHDDLTAATAHGVDYQGVSTPFLAGRLDPQWAREHKLDPEEFVTWVSSNQAGIGSLSEALERFTDWRESLNYRNTSGRGVRLAPPLFQAAFGRRSPDEDFFRMKREEFYRSKPLFRAQWGARRISDKELVGHFIRPKPVLGPSAGYPDFEPLFRDYNRQITRAPKRLLRRLPELHRRLGRQSPYAVFFEKRSRAKSHIKPATRDRYLLEVETLSRDVGAVETARSTELVEGREKGPRGVFLLGGTEPDAVETVTMTDYGRDGRRGGKRIARRLSWNRVELTEYSSANQVLRKAVYEIQPNGSLKER